MRKKLLQLQKVKRNVRIAPKPFIQESTYETKSYIFLTENGLEEYERERNEYYSAKGLLETLSNIAKLDDKKFLSTEKRLAENTNAKPSFPDVVWSLANEAVANIRDLETANSISFSMALFLQKTGKNPNRLLENFYRNQLKEYMKSDVVTDVEILSSGNSSCDDCKKLDGHCFTIEQALNEMPLPVKNCQNKNEQYEQCGWCRCVYTPIV